VWALIALVSLISFVNISAANLPIRYASQCIKSIMHLHFLCGKTTDLPRASWIYNESSPPRRQETLKSTRTSGSPKTPESPIIVDVWLFLEKYRLPKLRKKMWMFSKSFRKKLLIFNFILFHNIHEISRDIRTSDITDSFLDISPTKF